MEKEFLTTDEVKTIELNILDSIHNFCQENNIKYFIEAGTLLGAVRHGGFIPWDDDIDIGMMRDDYEKFLRLFPENGINGYKLLSPNTNKDCHITFSKVYDSTTIKQDEEFVARYWKYGVDVDVFPWDLVPDDKKERERYNRRIYFWFHVFLAIVGKPRKEETILKTLIKNSFVYFVKFLSLLHLLKADSLCRKINMLAAQYNNQSCNSACDIVLPDLGGVSKATNVAGLRNRVLLPFEQKEYWAPEAYDACLRSAYGDYMKLPPEEKRVTHHLSDFYRKKE